ncbi:hypothetical protein [Phreatobacter sp. AB_2022a]|uniref:hypothetical protein n=1 Tax=Phreatobacter sp. AB_2022a TaxID=3003134 RepID=UPI00056E240C|nr:hypothetical protein [Phreatobacter sp. AB_2022a]MCZ0736993.1 hypothetical protein [Phreatobacter sp. AB_2022a]CEJ09904.1 hypothetical protein BN1110_00175 [bacterium YEK0313]
MVFDAAGALFWLIILMGGIAVAVWILFGFALRAIDQIMASPASKPERILWSVLVLALPGVGLAIWALFGPRSEPDPPGR